MSIQYAPHHPSFPPPPISNVVCPRCHAAETGRMFVGHITRPDGLRQHITEFRMSELHEFSCKGKSEDITDT